MEHISPKDFGTLPGTEDWRVISDGANAYFRTGSMAAGARLVQAISELSDVDDHAPAVDVWRDGVTVRLVTYTESYYGMTDLDLELARQISTIARELGLVAEPSKVQSNVMCVGAPNRDEIMPFWQAVLGYERRNDSPAEDLVDPRGRNVPFWFEQMDEPRGDGGGAIHVSVWVPIEEAPARIAAALAAGGHMVRDEFAPSWWTLADAAGNECDIGTIEGR